MKKEKIFFTLSLLGILLLLFLLNFQKPTEGAFVKKISISGDKITISLVNTSTKVTLTSSKKLDLGKDNYLEIYGKKEMYRNQTYIYPDKLICKNCK